MAGELRAPLVFIDPLTEGDSSVRASLVFVDPLTEGAPYLRQSFAFVEPVTEGMPYLRQAFAFVEALTESFRTLRQSILFLEAMVPVWPEEYMSTDRFPGSLDSGISLPGLAFTWHKRPVFRTNKHSSASGVSVRNALMQYPIWEFEGTYEFLKGTNLEPQFQTLCGFFLARKGQFDTFLFKDSDDYLVVNGPSVDPADGVTTMFSFSRTMGSFVEKIGQVDTDKTITVYMSPAAEAQTIPISPGPYTITVDQAATFVEDLGVIKGGTPMTKVTGAPAAGEYAVNVLTGVYTFNATDNGDAVDISYRYTVDPADYTITLPNRVVFDSAPVTGTVSMDFEFFFVCIFKEDMLDFEKFADKFWELQTIEFESVPA